MILLLSRSNILLVVIIISMMFLVGGAPCREMSAQILSYVAYLCSQILSQLLKMTEANENAQKNSTMMDPSLGVFDFYGSGRQNEWQENREHGRFVLMDPRPITLYEV